MKTCDLFAKKTVFSFEVFPPKKDMPVETVFPTLTELSKLSPDFISVTYGAGGSENCKATLKIASRIKNEYGIESQPHQKAGLRNGGPLAVHQLGPKRCPLYFAGIKKGRH